MSCTSGNSKIRGNFTPICLRHNYLKVWEQIGVFLCLEKEIIILCVAYGGVEYVFELHVENA